MALHRTSGFVRVIGAAAAVIGLTAPPVEASVVTATPTLPVIGMTYTSAVVSDCFPAAGVCIVPQTITLTSLVSSTFGASGQDIVTTVSYSGLLTTLGNNPLGSLSLVGTIEQRVLGRTTSTDVGTWATELLGLTLSGSVMGTTLNVALDPSHPSTGQTSITSIGTLEEPAYRVDSFFDIFVDLTLEATTPLHTTRGPIRVTAAPEPGSLALAAGALATVAWRRRRTLAATHPGRADRVAA